RFAPPRSRSGPRRSEDHGPAKDSRWPPHRGGPHVLLFPRQRCQRSLLPRRHRTRFMPGTEGLGESACAFGSVERSGTLMRTYESDVCIIGGGISSAMLARKLSELRSGISITVVEAGRKLMDLEN